MAGHAPFEKRVSEVTITCAASGAEDYDIAGSPFQPVTLADLEEFCADLRRRGAGDGQVVDNDGVFLSVTLDLGTGGPR